LTRVLIILSLLALTIAFATTVVLRKYRARVKLPKSTRSLKLRGD
jgi:Na+-transporting methylmalonyl-CoA/oxaloacetate decarboxylase gamma subunit